MSDLPLFGAEEEFLLVDPRSGEPAPHNADVAAEAERRGIKLQLELSGCQVETTSSVAATSAELGEELTRLRRTAVEAAEAAGVQLLAWGLPPATPHEFQVAGPRATGGWVGSWDDRAPSKASADVTCTCRYPTAAPHPGQQLAAAWLPSFLALSANSALYRNADTGYASWRSVLWRRWPACRGAALFRFSRRLRPRRSACWSTPG